MYKRSIAVSITILPVANHFHAVMVDQIVIMIQLEFKKHSSLKLKISKSIMSDVRWLSKKQNHDGQCKDSEIKLMKRPNSKRLVFSSC